jgi:hypothetical protein
MKPGMDKAQYSRPWGMRSSWDLPEVTQIAAG